MAPQLHLLPSVGALGPPPPQAGLPVAHWGVRHAPPPPHVPPPPTPTSALQMDVSLKQRLIVDIRVMAPFITADIIQTSGIEQGGGTPEPMGGFWVEGVGGCGGSVE